MVYICGNGHTDPVADDGMTWTPANYSATGSQLGGQPVSCKYSQILLISDGFGNPGFAVGAYGGDAMFATTAASGPQGAASSTARRWSAATSRQPSTWRTMEAGQAGC